MRRKEEAIDKTLPLKEQRRIKLCRKYNKVDCCQYPRKHGCRGCEYNRNPELFDGGCILLSVQNEKK